MKKLLFLTLSLFILCGCSPQVEDSYVFDDNMYLAVKPGTFSPKGVVIDVRSMSCDLAYDKNAVILQRLSNGVWKTLEGSDTTLPEGTTEIPTYGFEKTIDWEAKFGELKHGIYRYVEQGINPQTLELHYAFKGLIIDDTPYMVDYVPDKKYTQAIKNHKDFSIVYQAATADISYQYHTLAITNNSQNEYEIVGGNLQVKIGSTWYGFANSRPSANPVVGDDSRDKEATKKLMPKETYYSPIPTNSMHIDTLLYPLGKSRSFTEYKNLATGEIVFSVFEYEQTWENLR